ncbi:MAG TPA: hypothetical protein DCP53_07630 [Elusimicrobia bacterium]|nr:MAG: hypothetical protein A2551_07580 [Elusimicrobia bacterium RIFOXYD2_FULL_34_30]HAM39242.1 hypothetical protein [Elusimicrobiota bacterium]
MKKLFFILLIAFSIIFLVLLVSNQNKEVFIKNPTQYLPPEKLNKLIINTRSKIEKNPEDIISYIELGIAYYQKGIDSYTDAINYLRKAVKLGSMDIRTLFYLGIMYDELNLTEKAFNYYEKYLRNDPNDVYIRLRYGNLYFRLNRYESASEQYETIYAQEPKNQTAIINLALSYKARNMHDKALETFDEAQKLRPVLNSEVLVKIAELYYLKNDFVNAELYYKRVLKDKEESVIALTGLCQTYLKMNRNKEAKKYIEQILTYDPNNEQVKKILKKGL